MDIEKEIKKIQNRNKKVEAEKAWETSGFRAGSITVITYIVAVLVMFVLDIKKPFFGAVIPTLGFVISIQSLPFIKKWWIKNHHKK